jgi:diacylglycerol kinase (ATP)
MTSPRRRITLFESFNFAIEGILHTLRTQRNMRIHLVLAVGVLAAAVALNVDRFELIALILAIGFVLLAEMVNTAIESAVDLATTSFDPMAKLAKDIAAGAVLISSVVAAAVGYLIFSGKIAKPSTRYLEKIRDAPLELTLVALGVTVLVVLGLKAWTGRGTPLRGGLPSGHAAIAFAGWMAATYVLHGSEHRFLVSTVTLVMALLVAQTRVEAGVHSVVEVAAGGLVGALVTLLVFQALS